MPEALVLVILAALGALVILGVGLLAFRAVGGSDRTPMPAAYRVPGGQWRRGLLRFDGDHLALKGPGGLSAGPWIRGNLDLGVADKVTGDEARALGREGLTRVDVIYGTSTFELALGEGHYTALRAWVEAVPPGWNSSVA